MILAAAFVVVSCNEDGSVDPEVLDNLILDAKWEFESGDYASFEFNEYGDYIVVCNDSSTGGLTTAPRFASASRATTNGSSIITGDYEGDGDNAVKMNGFGRIELTSITSSSVSFSLTLEGEIETVNYTASIAEVVATSDNTTMLCRKWDLVGYTEDGVTDILSDDDAKTVLFSKAGTYLIEWSDGTSVLAQWKWKSESDKTFYFTWSDEWYEDKYVTITTLTSSKAVVYEDYGDDGYGISTLTPSK